MRSEGWVVQTVKCQHEMMCVAVRGHDALRASRRPRRVDHVAKMCRRVRRDAYTVLIQGNDGPGKDALDAIAERVLAHNQGYFRFIEDKAEAFVGMGGIDRNVSRAGFKAGENGDDGFLGAIEAKPDQSADPSSKRTQMVSEPIGLRLQFCIGQGKVAADEGRRIAARVSLHFEQFVQTTGREWRCKRVAACVKPNGGDRAAGADRGRRLQCIADFRRTVSCIANGRVSRVHRVGHLHPYQCYRRTVALPSAVSDAVSRRAL